VSRRLRETYSGHARLCVCVCVSVPRHMPTLLHGPGCNLGNGRSAPLVVHYWADLQSGARVWLLCQYNAEREMSASACTRSMPSYVV